MIPTLIGVATILLGFWLLLRRGPMELLCATLAFNLLDGSAGVILTSLGGSSIPPGRIMLGFLALSCFTLVKQDSALFRRAIADNVWMVIFCIYSFVGAFLLPRIFQQSIDVFPLRPIGMRHQFDTIPLFFTSQNITTAVYLVGTGLAALCCYIAVTRSKNLNPIITAAVWITVTHAVLGILGVALRGTPWDQVVEFFRNGAYSQVDQRTRNFIRINGIMPEPSIYADFGIAWFILCFELWLRHIRPLATGLAAALMAVVLMLSTSSTAYVGFAGYAVILLCRAALMPSYLRADKLIAIGAIALFCVAFVALLLIASSEAAQAFEEMIRQMTVEKANSDSGLQRAFWARQGLDAFMVSYGLGIGAGSFRSSSIITAILGGMGVVGIVSFLAYILKVIWPQSDVPAGSREADIADALGWTAVASLVPAILTQASPDPGVDFACFAGIAIALKRRAAIFNLTFDRAVRIQAPAVRRPAGWRHVSR
jgi:hypothetical protein